MIFSFAVCRGWSVLTEGWYDFLCTTVCSLAPFQCSAVQCSGGIGPFWRSSFEKHPPAVSVLVPLCKPFAMMLMRFSIMMMMMMMMTKMTMIIILKFQVLLECSAPALPPAQVPSNDQFCRQLILYDDLGNGEVHICPHYNARYIYS